MKCHHWGCPKEALDKHSRCPEHLQARRESAQKRKRQETESEIDHTSPLHSALPEMPVGAIGRIVERVEECRVIDQFPDGRERETIKRRINRQTIRVVHSKVSGSPVAEDLPTALEELTRALPPPIKTHFSP